MKVKKILSFLLCAVMAFGAVSGTVLQGTPLDISVTAEAASSYNKTMLPYCYYKLTDEEKLAYLKVRTAFIDHKDSLKISVPTGTMDKISNIMRDVDVMTSFNFPFENGGLDYYYYEDTGLTESVEFDYNFTKKSYDTIIKKADEAAAKVISKFTDKTTKYAKIKYIHDYIINKSVYSTEGNTGNSIYGALVKGSAKCDGYSHAFHYICEKAGIRVVTVLGETTDSDDYHAWNKVYYNKKWYNVDVTWDDPDDNTIENKSYRYFMISDKVISADHSEVDLGYYVPAATADGADYYTKNGLCAKTVNEAKDILSEEIYQAAKDGKSSVTIRFSSKSVYDDTVKCFEDTDDLFDILEKAGKRAGAKVITDGYNYNNDDNGMYTFTVYFYYKGTALSDYYIDISQLSKDDVDFLTGIGLKNA